MNAEPMGLIQGLTSLLPRPTDAQQLIFSLYAPLPLLQALLSSTWGEQQDLQSWGLGLSAQSPRHNCYLEPQ